MSGYSVVTAFCLLACVSAYYTMTAEELEPVHRAEEKNVHNEKIQCDRIPNAWGGHSFAYKCPTGFLGQPRKCVRYQDLCNQIADCPNGEDEHQSMCFFHRMWNLHATAMQTALEKLNIDARDIKNNLNAY